MISKPVKRLTKAIAALGTALFLYFLWKFGAAFLKGFVIGASIGGGIGAGVGVAIGLSAPPILWPVTVPLGIVVGGTTGAFVFGLAGGLIAAGLAAGNTTAVSTGVGAGSGGAVGGYAGFTLGTAVAGVVLLTASAVCLAFPILCPVMGFIAAASAPIIILTFTAAGAALGALVGGAIGYAIGQYVITPIKEAVQGTYSTITSASIPTGGGVVGGFFATVGGFFAGLGGAIWGGIQTVGGFLWGGLTAAADFIVGGLGGLSLPASAASIPVFGAVGTVAVGSTLVGIVTSTTFFNPETDLEFTRPGQNQYFTIAKTANPTSLTNPTSDTDVTFTITLTARNLTLNNVSVTDVLKVQSQSSSFNVTTDKNGRSISPIPCPATIPPGGNCTYSFTIVATSSFNDSVIINTVTTTATPQDQTPYTDSATATVSVGSPPAQCPRGWPTTGQVSQGPEGATSHGNPSFGPGYEAIDIAQAIGIPVYSTVEGIVVESWQRGDDILDQRLGIQPFACPGLTIVNFWHLSAKLVNIGDTVGYGQTIAKVGAYQGAPHLHYQFNPPGDRSFPIEPPYIPQNVPRACDSISECNITITNAP